MKKTFYLLYAVFFFVPLLLQGQSDSTDTKLVSFNALFRFQAVDFSGFNQTASDLGYQTLESRLVGYGGEFQYEENRSVHSLGFLWYEANNETAANASQKGTFFDQWEILVRSEYDLLRDDRWVLSPGLGWGFQWSRLGLSDRTEVNGVGQALDTEVQKITRFDVPVELGLNVQRHIRLGDNMSNLLLGLRGGYRFILGDDEWKTDGTVPMSNTGLSLSGWFLSLRVGFSGRPSTGWGSK